MLTKFSKGNNEITVGQAQAALNAIDFQIDSDELNYLTGKIYFEKLKLIYSKLILSLARIGEILEGLIPPLQILLKVSPV